MSDAIISVEGLGKKYFLRHQTERYTALRDVIADKAKSLFRRNGGTHLQSPNSDLLTSHASTEEFWALRDVNFEVKRGEVLGIIGRNGAGKTTLLKILSRITDPTEGRVRIRGRIASLLEVGTGFHPELTGRENIYLNGAILGMTRAEIKKKFDEIVAFAETEKFLDTPVKHYSSGMYVRLAFAVAAHLEPEILVVDEVLAVGDAQFQKKCLGKMESVSRKEGRTVLFVSHNMTAVGHLCRKVAWLHDGMLRRIGPTQDIISEYLGSIDASATQHRRFCRTTDKEASLRADLVSVSIAGVHGQPLEQLAIDTPFDVAVEYINRTPGNSLNVSISVYNHERVCVLSSFSKGSPHECGIHRAIVKFPANLLNCGMFSVRVLLVRDYNEVVTDFDSALAFEIKDCARAVPWYGTWSGVVRPQLEWETEIVSRELSE